MPKPDYKQIKEPFKTYAEMQKLAERGKALYCYQEHVDRKRTYEDIGKELGVSRAYVDQLARRIKNELSTQ